MSTEAQINLKYFSSISSTFSFQPCFYRRKLRIAEYDALRVVLNFFHFNLELIFVIIFLTTFFRFLSVFMQWGVRNWVVKKLVEVEWIVC
jgi:hypothetical protein